VAPKLSRNVKALGWVSFLNDVHSETILPLLPFFMTQVLGLNRTFLGLIEGIVEGTASFLQVFAGWYSDKTRSRKKPTAIGYIISALSKPMLAFSTAGYQVLGIRFANKVGKGIRMAPRDALIAESATPGTWGRAFGFNRMMDTLGAVVGTLIAYAAISFLGGTEGYRMRAAFLASTVFGVAAVVVVLVFVRETESFQQHNVEKSDPLPSSTSRVRLALFIGVNSLFYLGMFSYAFFLLRAQGLGLDTKSIPLIYLLYNIIYALVALPIGRLADRIGIKPVILLAYSTYAIVCFGFAFSTYPWHAWALFCLYGIHSATIHPASRALVAGLAEAGSRGAVLGIYHTSVGLAVLPASLVAGLLWDSYGARVPFLLAGLLAITATIAMIPLRLEGKN
jgi:MFS family permease